MSPLQKSYDNNPPIIKLTMLVGYWLFAFSRRGTPVKSSKRRDWDRIGSFFKLLCSNELRLKRLINKNLSITIILIYFDVV